MNSENFFDSYIINNESLSTETVSALIRTTTDIFPEYLDEKKLLNYSSKLTKFGRFITIRKQGDNKIVSVIAYYSNTPPLCYISFVCVIPEFKRKGLSQIMLSFLENYARQVGLNVMQLEVRKNNESAINAYLKSGFVISEDASINSFYMTKDLN